MFEFVSFVTRDIMSVKINHEKCTRCLGQDEPYCIKYCPGDLLAIDSDSGKVYIRSDRDCWDCMVCVKSCPFQAVETRLSYQLASYTASLVPEIHKTKIIWHLKDINGKEEVFEIPTTGNECEVPEEKVI